MVSVSAGDEGAEREPEHCSLLDVRDLQGSIHGGGHGGLHDAADGGLHEHPPRPQDGPRLPHKLFKRKLFIKY